jgi:hypothetical protein
LCDAMRGPQFDFPLHHVLDTPGLVTAPGSVYRCVLAIACAYWQSGCILTTDSDTTLMAISRMPSSNYFAAAEEIRVLWDEIKPLLDGEYKVRDKRHARQSAVTERMRAAQRAKRALRQSVVEPITPVLPQREQRTPSALVNQPTARAPVDPLRRPFKGPGFTD